MVLMYTPRDRTPQELLTQGFNDGARCCEIIQEMKEIKNVGESNRKYVEGLITGRDKEMDAIEKRCGFNFAYHFQRDRLTEMLGERITESELKKMELDYLASSNNE